MQNKKTLLSGWQLLAPAMVVILMSGCSLKPEYVRPEAPVPVHYSSNEKEASMTLPEWKQFFRDENIQRVIGLALENNRDLRISMLNIEKTRAQYQIQRADLLPSINATSSGISQRLPDAFSNNGVAGVSRQYAVSLGFSAFELDLFGKIRNLTEQALENFYSVEENAKTARLSLVAETAGIYLQLVADREIYDLTQSTLENRQKNLELVERKFHAGVASDLDVSQARSLVDEARTSLASAATRVGQDENYLALLMGAPIPADLPEVRKLSEVASIMDLPAGLPSSLLVNRPDIKAAEHTLKGANANIGAARANFFPTISLTGDFGRMSSEYSNLFSGGGKAWSFLPSISLPIFDMGRNVARLEVSKVDKDIAIAQYEKAIQTAFREVADTLIYRANVNEQLSAQESLVNSTTKSYQHATTRYLSGVSAYINVLDAQRSLYVAQSSFVNTRLQREANALTLYKTLGGGSN